MDKTIERKEARADALYLDKLRQRIDKVQQRILVRRQRILDRHEYDEFEKRMERKHGVNTHTQEVTISGRRYNVPSL